MKPKYYLPLSDHPELADQDKAKYKNVVQWRYDNSSKGKFLERDRVVRSATREVSGGKAVRDDLYGGVLIVIALILWFLLGYALMP